MNGELRTTPMPERCSEKVGWLQCTCCMDACSQTRRTEYLKSLKSFSVISCFAFIIYFVITVSVGGFVSPRQNPFLGPSATTLIKMGAMYPPYIKAGHIYRWFTPIIMHAGVIHLFMNTFTQWRFGLFAERRWGLWRYLVIFFTSGVLGSIASSLKGGKAVSVGASGSLMGVIAAVLVDIYMHWNSFPTLGGPLPFFLQVSSSLIIGIAMGFLPYIDFWAHSVGAIAGALTYLLIHSHLIENEKIRLWTRIGVAATLGLFTIISLACFFTVVKIPKV